MALISPGVEITIIDESQYVSARINTVPYLLIATAENKINAAGSSLAAGTLASSSDDVYLITSQRELVNTFGNPFFYKTSNGDSIYGYELNEYGLMAAYSTLGTTNQVYVQRADVDLAELSASLVRPTGNPTNGTAWLDTTETQWGIFRWNNVSKIFLNQQPILINKLSDLEVGTVPFGTIGQVGDYAVVTIIQDNPIYFKNDDNEWVLIGSDSWKDSIPTVTGSVSAPVITPTETLYLEPSDGSGPLNYIVPAGVTTAALLAVDLQGAIVAAGITSVRVAATSDQKIEFIVTSGGGSATSSIDLSVTLQNSANIAAPALVNGVEYVITVLGDTDFTLVGAATNTVGTVFTATGPGVGTGVVRQSTGLCNTIGIIEGTYAAPVVAIEPHTNIPRWRSTDTNPRPSGSVWIKTTAVNEGMNLVLRKYNSVSDTFDEQAVPVYKSDAEANKWLDPGFGGSTIPAGNTYALADVYDNDTGTVKILERKFGATEITGNEVSLTSPAITIGNTFDISVSLPNDVNMTLPTTVTISATATGATVADIFITDVNTAIGGDANFLNLTFEKTSTGRVKMIHKAGGVVKITEPTGNSSFTSVLIGGTQEEVTTLTNVAGDNLYSVSNWIPLQYTAGEVEPGQDPVDGTRWYYSAIDDIDIMIQDDGAWRGYRNVTNDVHGFDLSKTDSTGVLVAALAPDEQADDTALEYGDLWIDTSDLEHYPKLSRWEDVNGVDRWVAIDNSDQTSIDGILFADARWGANDNVDPINSDLPVIADMLLEDYVDIDVPNPDLYPPGTLLWNTRRSGFNVKEYRVDYFNATDFNNNVLPTERNTWVSVSGLKDNGSPNMGRQAQRALVVEAMRAAIDTNEDVREEQREFNLIATPGYPELIPNMVALNNERNNTGFVIGDSPMRLKAQGNAITEWATNNGGTGTSTEDGLVSNDEYTGVFYPSGKTNDLTGADIIVPPSHMMLRTIIHSDEQSYPWFAPAGVRRGQIDNATGIGYIDEKTGEFKQIAVREAIRDVLYQNNVNPIAFIPGAGIINHGNKTTQPGTALDRINVSRLVSYIRKNLEVIAKPFLFEPNDTITRNEIKNLVESFLNDLIAKRGLYDYAVVCDKSNNTPARIDRNELWVDLAIEPVKATEFIFIPVRIKNTGEISGNVNGN